MSSATITSSDGHTFSAYVVGPDDAAAGVVIVQEVFGVNSHIRAVADRMAEAGYRVAAPAVYDRVQRDFEVGYEADDLQAGMALARQLDLDDVIADVTATVAFLDRPCGVVGFCFGGTVAWKAAAEAPVAAAVGYYGGGVLGMADLTPRVPTMLHFGRLDHAIPADEVEAFAAERPEVDVFLYDDAQHGFNCDQRASFHAESAAAAWDRTVAFLAEHLPQQP